MQDVLQTTESHPHNLAVHHCQQVTQRWDAALVHQEPGVTQNTHTQSEHHTKNNSDGKWTDAGRSLYRWGPPAQSCCPSQVTQRWDAGLVHQEPGVTQNKHTVLLLLFFFFCVPQLYLWGSPLWGEISAYVTGFFNPTIKEVTFHLRGWCMLGVFLLPAFTRLGHERQDLLSPCDEMHVCTD